MKRVFSFLLVLLLVASLMPMQVLAETTDAHSVNVSVVGKGMVSVSPDMASAGQTVTVNCVPGDGMELKEITADRLGQIYPYSTSFTMPDGDITVTVKFGAIGDSEDDENSPAYVVCVYVLGGNPLDQEIVSATPGSSYQFVPYGDYEIDRVEAKDGGTYAPVSVSNSWCAEVPANGLIAHIYLKESGSSGNGGNTPQPTEHNITVNEPEHGTVTISDTDKKAKAGDTIKVTTTANDGYELDKITVTCGSEEIDVDTEGKFTMPAGDVTVTVTFKAKQQPPQNPPAATEYNITVNTPEHGTVSGVPAKAKKDDVITVTTSPAEGYELDEITVTCNGTPVTVTDGKFVMPEGNVTVTVTFKAKQTLPSGLSFSYAYDVQRYPVYPKKGDNFRVSGFDYPYGPSGQLDSNEGPWVLSPVGKYSANKNLSRNLTGIVNGIAQEYGVPADDLPIHKLTQNGKFIAYGVLIMHNSSKQVAFFIGDSLSGSGAGYFFSKNVQSGTQNYDVPKDVTDQVNPSNKIQITFDPNNGDATSDSKLDPGDKLNEVPSANRDDHVFTGWFTEDGTPVTKDTVFTEDTTVYARWAAHTTEPANNAFRANINMANQAVVDMLVTQRDKQQGQDVRVFMNVERLNTENVPSGDKTAIIGMAGSKKVAAFLDIQLLKQIGTATPTPIHNTETNMVPIIMKLDDEVIPSGAGKDTFTIIYHHVENGAATTDEISANFDVATKTLTFQANKFSTYALVVKEKAPTGTLDKVVKSGDISGFNGMSMLLLCCAVALAGVAVYDKKRTK